jgi:hypothetical protein
MSYFFDSKSTLKSQLAHTIANGSFRPFSDCLPTFKPNFLDEKHLQVNYENSERPRPE